MDGSGQIVAEYVWGLLEPIARIDLQNPANTRYYVIDGLGHVRALVAPNVAITEVWHYDSWATPSAPLPSGLSSRFCGTARMGTSISPSPGCTMSALASTTPVLNGGCNETPSV